MPSECGGDALGGVVGLGATGNPGLVGVVGDACGEPSGGVATKVEDGVVGETEEAVSGVVPTGNPGHSPQYRLQPALQHSQQLLSLRNGGAAFRSRLLNSAVAGQTAMMISSPEIASYWSL